MSKELIDKLSNLKMAQNLLRRTLDTKSFSTKNKAKIFKQIIQVEEEMNLIRFKLKLEKEMKKNENM